jgi:parallel beta-helix repeat protein
MNVRKLGVSVWIAALAAAVAALAALATRRERIIRRLGLSLIVALALSVAVGSASGHVGLAQPGCGDTITVDTALTNDLLNCPNNGIVIGADDITLDLNGHVIDGDGAEFADCPPDEACDIGILDFDHQGVTIKGGEVREFTFGALVVGASDSHVTRLVLKNHFFSGLLVAESSRSEIDGLTVSGNGLTTDQAGVDIFDSHHLTLSRNAVFANGDIGFFVSGLDDGRFEENSVAGNPEAGILLDHGNRNEFSDNRFSNNGDGIALSGDANTVAGNRLSGPLECPEEFCGHGISLEGGSGNLIERNVVLGFHHAGILVASFEEFGGPPTVGSTITGNLIRGSAVEGLLVGPTPTDTWLTRNIAIGAGDDGIHVDSAETTLTRNLAVHNGDLGIEAVPGVTDGGGNHATANGNPAQCTNVVC